MKLYFMKKEALELLKNNLSVYRGYYYTEEDNSWIYKLCGDDCFVEFKDVPPFELYSISGDTKKGDIEFNNCKIIYRNLKFLKESQACDERLWAGLCHTTFYPYIRKRWDYDKSQKKSREKDISEIKSRFFCEGGSRSSLYRNTLSKCWWVGRLTYDDSYPNPFQKLDYIGSSDISTKINEIFYSNKFSANKNILNGIVKGFKHFDEEGMVLSTIRHVRPTLQLFNALGGSLILDCMNEDEIADIFIENIYAINQGEDSAIEVGDNFQEYSDTDDDILSEYQCEDTLSIITDELDKISIDYDDRIVEMGNKVKATKINNGVESTYVINYNPGTNQMPALSQKMLGKRIGDIVEYKETSYRIDEIID